MTSHKRFVTQVAFVVACVLIAGCAVETPRDGFTTSAGARSGARTSQFVDGTASGDDQPATASDASGTAAADGTTSGAGGQDATGGSQAAGGTGASGATGGGGTAGGSSAAGAASRQASDVGVTRDSITISYSGQFSGPLGAAYQKGYDNGVLAWVTDVNGRGGINGRKVIMKRIDNAGTAEGGLAACRQETSNGSFVVLLGSAVDAEPSCVNDAGVPGLTQLISATDQPWKVMRAVQSTPLAGKAVAHFVAKGLHAGGKKLGIIYLNDPSFKASADFLKATAQQLGINVVVSQSVEPNQGSFVSELSRVRSAGAEVVGVIVAAEILGILRDAQAINYHPTWTGVPWALDELSAAARAQMDGIRALRVNATADSRGFAAYSKVANAQGKAAPSSTDATFYGYSLMLEHYLVKAGINPTRKSFVAAIDSGEPFDNGINPPVRWGGGKVLGSNSWFPALCCDTQNRWKSLGPASETAFN